MDDADLVAAALQARLERVTFTDLDSDAVSKLLIDTAATWANDQGWRVYRRAASITRLPPPYEHLHSFLDLACARSDAPPVAIEVDHTARQRTLDKLQAEAMAGRIAIWIRWSQRQFDPAPASIRAVNVAVTSRNGLHSRIVGPAAPEHSTFDVNAAEQPHLFG
jgi:hypothetical protein